MMVRGNGDQPATAVCDVLSRQFVPWFAVMTVHCCVCYELDISGSESEDSSAGWAECCAGFVL
jgi:hypothetical protein